MNVPDIYAGSYVISLGLFRAEKNLPESNLSWDTSSSEVWLIQDLLTASGGEPGALREGAYEATFANLLSAILCARRIQWALHGLAQHQNRRGILATILIRSGKPEASQLGIESVIFLNEMRGKILIEKGLSNHLDSLSTVIPCRTCESCLEVLWEDNLTALEPEFLKSSLRISELPKSDIATPASELIPASEPEAGYDLPPSISNYDGPFGSVEETGKWRVATSRNWLIAVGIGMLAVLLIILIFAHAHQSGQVDTSAQVASSNQAATQPSPSVPQPPTPAPATPVSTMPTEAQRPVIKTPKREPRSAKTQKLDENAAKATKGSCDFSQAEIERSLNRADNNLHAGNFTQALQAYRQVVDCPTAHERAQQGITSTKQKMTLQGLSDPNE